MFNPRPIHSPLMRKGSGDTWLNENSSTQEESMIVVWSSFYMTIKKPCCLCWCHFVCTLLSLVGLRWSRWRCTVEFKSGRSAWEELKSSLGSVGSCSFVAFCIRLRCCWSRTIPTHNQLPKSIVVVIHGCDVHPFYCCCYALNKLESSANGVYGV